VNDYAGLLSPAERERLEALLTERERAAGPQMAIAVFRSLDGESVEDVANRLFQKWRLGSKALDNGVLLVLFVQDRKVRIEVGYGLEAVLTDAVAAQIIREALAPRFREQRYAAGLEAAVSAVYERIAPSGAPGEPQRTAAASRRGLSTREIYLLFFLACAGITFFSFAWNASHQRGYTAGRRGWGSPGTGGWYGGGFGGGGWGGGGGSSGGGFSGGGGSSGGGGASGSW
jgi:uncharacterized protein